MVQIFTVDSLISVCRRNQWFCDYDIEDVKLMFMSVDVVADQTMSRDAFTHESRSEVSCSD